MPKPLYEKKMWYIEGGNNKIPIAALKMWYRVYRITAFFFFVLSKYIHTVIKTGKINKQK